MKNRDIQITSKESIGKLYVRKVSTGGDWSFFAEALGHIAIPQEMAVRLVVSATIDFDPNVLSTLDPDSLDVFEWVSTSNVTDTALLHIRHLTGLRGLALWETSLSNLGLSHLQNLCSLEWLDIGTTSIDDDGLRFLMKLDRLDYLTLLDDRITDAGVKDLCQLESLSGLDLMNTFVTDKAVEYLRRVHRLRHLRIVNTLITEKGYITLRTLLPHCDIRYHK
jgi:hypothetical protein